VVSATNRDLWQGPKQEVPESRTSGLCAQPQKFETITVTIGYKNGQLLRLRVTLAPAARGLDPWRWPKGSQLWGLNVSQRDINLVPRGCIPFGQHQGCKTSGIINVKMLANRNLIGY